MIKITLEEGAKVNAHINGHIIKTDQPENGGGENSEPAPFDLFLASIGTCAGIYAKRFCEQRNISTRDIQITQEINYNKEKRLIDNIKLVVDLPDDFPEKYKKALVKSIDLCAVKKHLIEAPVIETVTV